MCILSLISCLRSFFSTLLMCSSAICSLFWFIAVCLAFCSVGSVARYWRQLLFLKRIKRHISSLLAPFCTYYLPLFIQETLHAQSFNCSLLTCDLFLLSCL